MTDTTMHMTNFKNFETARFDPSQPLTILLGRNGSGKTNIIEGLELLAALAHGTPLNEITDINRGGTFELRGGLPSCIRSGQTKLGLRFEKAAFPFDGNARSVDYLITFAAHGKHDVRLHSERLQVGESALFEAESSDGELLTVTCDDSPPGTNPSCRIPADRSVLSRYEGITKDVETNHSRVRESIATVRSVRDHLRRSFTLNPQPKMMRKYVRTESSPRLSRNGANLSATLLALHDGDEKQRAALQRITETIRQIPDNPFAKIGFAETPIGDVMAGFVPWYGAKPDGGKLLDARILSDGTLRMLAIVTALETIPKSSRIAIKEIDNGLHPSRTKLLVRTLAEAARRRELNVLATTHNPAFMNALDESHMDGILICHRDGSESGSRVTPLGDLDIVGTPALHGGLGNFMTRNALERHLDPAITSQRSRAVQEWLASLP